MGEQIEKNDTAGTCSTVGRGEVHTGFWWGKLRERDHLEDPGIGGRIILRWIFRKWNGGGMDWIGLAQDRVRWRAVAKAVMTFGFRKIRGIS